jgi:hypothetical protein
MDGNRRGIEQLVNDRLGRPDAAWQVHLAGALYVNTILRLNIKDTTAGIKAWHASTPRAIDVESVHSNGFAFQVETNYRTGPAGPDHR